jgi:murein DD-endopeptidase MepM/ murein hydrolase activator NlpD
MKTSNAIIYLIIFLLVIFAFYFIFFNKKAASYINSGVTASNNNSASQPTNKITAPISNALNRITKKPFGLKVSPNNSPISPEKFSGYHTGIDFETTPAEQKIDVPIFAVCAGPLLLKEWASGYGGVAVQKCELNNQTVTIIYGHLKLASIQVKVNQELIAGEQIGILGKGYSTETDGERKHLHLGIHLGPAINILGYVQKVSELSQWLDAEKYL